MVFDQELMYALIKGGFSTLHWNVLKTLRIVNTKQDHSLQYKQSILLFVMFVPADSADIVLNIDFFLHLLNHGIHVAVTQEEKSKIPRMVA